MWLPGLALYSWSAFWSKALSSFHSVGLSDVMLLTFQDIYTCTPPESQCTASIILSWLYTVIFLITLDLKSSSLSSSDFSDLSTSSSATSFDKAHISTWVWRVFSSNWNSCTALSISDFSALLYNWSI